MLVLILLLLSLFARKTFALTKEELCADDSVTCYCSKTNSNSCVLQVAAPSGHTHKIANKTQCGCSSDSPQKMKSASTVNDGINLCDNPGVVKSFQIAGWGLFIIRIVAPLLLIIFAAIDIGKAVFASDDNAIKSAISTAVKRAIAAIIIFFVPTIISLVFTIVGSASESKSKYSCLTACINRPSKCSVPSSVLFNK